MNCTDFREQLPDVASGAMEAPPEVEEHLANCSDCAGAWKALQQTMALLDEWQTPEPSPFFDVRIQALLREEREKRSANWFAWLRKPAFGIAATLVLAAGVGLFEGGRTPTETATKQPAEIQQQKVVAKTGTAVGDLQYLDKHMDLLQGFDALDVADDDTPQSN